MSLRYTGEATMDQPALRDVERWKDKIEVRLDNRQVFFLFFGSAMVACMLFVLGVIVGKRLETRGRAEAPTLEDPLAVLDRFGGAAAQAAPAPLAFPRALIGTGTTNVSPGKPRAALERAEKPAKAERAEPVERAEKLAKAEPVERAEKPVKADPVVPAPAKATLASTVAAAPAAKPLPVVEAPVPPMPPPGTPSSRKLAALPRPLAGPGVTSTAKTPTSAAPAAKPAPPKAVAAAAKAAPAAPPAEKSKGKFLLQLSSFPDRAEADAFARKFAGQNAYVVASEIPGKGTWYRVRVGSYSTMQEATAAKTNFERDHNVIAYVAGSGPAK